MYGHKVHQSVKDAGELNTGITVHLVNEYFDLGEVILQVTVPIACDDTVKDIADKVHQLEYLHYPKLIDKLLFSDNVK